MVNDNDDGPVSHILYASWLQTCTLYVLQIQFKLYKTCLFPGCIVLKPFKGHLQVNDMFDLHTMQWK